MDRKTFILSDESVNSYGFAVKTAGIDLSHFKANPVMLFNHDTSKVIGKWDNIRVEDNKLLADADFDMNDPEAAKIASKVEGGYIKGTSCGLYKLAISESTDANGNVTGYTATKCIIKEASIAPVPSNSNALRLYNDEGIQLSHDEVQLMVSETTKKTPYTRNTMSKLKLHLIQCLALQNVNLSDTDSDEAFIAAFDAQQKSKNDQIATLVAAEKQREKDLSESIIQGMVDDAQKAGKITEPQKAGLVTLAAGNVENLRNLLATMPAHTPPPSEGQGAVDKDKWMQLGWKELDEQGLLPKLKEANLGLFKEKFETQFNKEYKD